MIVVSNRIPVHEDHHEAFEERFANRAADVETMPGFLSFHLLRPISPDDPYVVMTFWESHEHYEAWINSEAFKQGHARASTLPREAFLGRPTLEVMEVISSTAT